MFAVNRGEPTPAKTKRKTAKRAARRRAALRCKLPLGGAIAEDYSSDEMDAQGTTRKVRLSALFAPGKDTLVVYNFMYGPSMKEACPSCTSILNGVDGSAQHVTLRVNLAMVAKSPRQRIVDFARERGWRHLRLISSAGNSYNRTYFGEQGDQMPMLNVFVRKNGKIHHKRIHCRPRAMFLSTAIEGDAVVFKRHMAVGRCDVDDPTHQGIPSVGSTTRSVVFIPSTSDQFDVETAPRWITTPMNAGRSAGSQEKLDDNTDPSRRRTDYNDISRNLLGIDREAHVAKVPPLRRNPASTLTRAGTIVCLKRPRK